MKRLLLPALLAALVLAGCTDPDPEKTRGEPEATSGAATTGAADPTAGAPAALEAFYAQEVDWEECGPDLECTRVEVPLDHDDPAGDTIDIAVTRMVSAGEGARSLFLNPGGPGGSGTAMMEWIAFSVSPAVMAEYNLVGFDPRGVNLSTSVECLTDEELDEWRSADVDTDSEAGLAAYSAAMEEFGDKCAQNSGELLGEVDTDSVARDLDILRAVVARSETLDYLGYSYGTFLGAVYADMFPERVGRFVLDGAVDPSLSISGLALGQAAGFEASLRAYMEDCLASDGCPFTGTVDEGLAQLRRLIDVTAVTPLPTGDPDRPLTRPLAISGIVLPMYEDAIWPQLTAALDAAMTANDGSQLLYWADYGAGRLEDGTYEDNSNEAFMAINCLDYPVEGTLADWQEDAAQMAEISPTLGDALAYTEVTCDVWPHRSDRVREELAAAGSAPILVVGTTGDPATPYEWSVSLAGQLEEGHLLTFDGWGHTAYGRSNACVGDAVDDYLLTGALPADGATC